MLKLIKDILSAFKPIKSLHVAYDSGNQKRPTIVLLHGIAATSGTWSPLIKEIDRKKYRVIALDLLGFGKSPKPAGCNYKVDDHIKYIRRTLRHLNIHKPFVLIGHSMGSIIAARYCYRYHRDIKEAFLLSLPLYLKNDSSQKSFADRHTDLYINIYKFLLDNKDFTIKHSGRLRKLLKIDDGVEVTEENWDGFRLSLSNTIIEQDASDDIKNTNVPIEIIYGEFDEFLVQKNIDSLSVCDNVKITKLSGVDHQVGSKFSKIVAEMIKKS